MNQRVSGWWARHKTQDIKAAGQQDSWTSMILSVKNSFKATHYLYLQRRARITVKGSRSSIFRQFLPLKKKKQKQIFFPFLCSSKYHSVLKCTKNLTSFMKSYAVPGLSIFRQTCKKPSYTDLLHKGQGHDWLETKQLNATQNPGLVYTTTTKRHQWVWRCEMQRVCRLINSTWPQGFQCAIVVKVLFGTFTSHIGVSVQVLATPIQIQFPDRIPEKAADHGSITRLLPC